MNTQSSLTSLMSAFGRIYHGEHDQPLIFDDTLSRELLSESEYQQIKAYMLNGIDFFAPEKRNDFSSSEALLQWIIQSQIAPTPLARARFCEDTLKSAVLAGTSQYVILGAGMDTFDFRNKDMLEKLHVFELDQPKTQEDKIKRIKNAGWQFSKNMSFIPIDFSQNDIVEHLLSYGFDKRKSTFFSCLGVTYYLTKKQIAHIFKGISSIALKGSILVFDYGTKEIYVSPVKRVQNMLAMAQAGGEPMKSAFNFCELEQILEENAFILSEHMSTEDIQEKYFAGRTDYLKAFEHIQYVKAIVK